VACQKEIRRSIPAKASSRPARLNLNAMTPLAWAGKMLDEFAEMRSEL
jgi:hypothetical protein